MPSSIAENRVNNFVQHIRVLDSFDGRIVWQTFFCIFNFELPSKGSAKVHENTPKRHGKIITGKPIFWWLSRKTTEEDWDWRSCQLTLYTLQLKAAAPDPSQLARLSWKIIQQISFPWEDSDESKNLMVDRDV
jgi:hypothetical protein